MVNECKGYDKDIEVNIVKLGLIKDEMCRDRRIKKSLMHKIPLLSGGKALLPNELKNKYRNKKICYCCHERNFNKTIKK